MTALLTPRWYPLREIPAYGKLVNSSARFDVIEAGRRCLAEGTMVATPSGPRPIESLKVGDVVFGFDGTGPVKTTVRATWINGEQEVIEVRSRSRCYLEATHNHKLWCCNEHTLDKRKSGGPKFKRTAVADLGKRVRVRREYLGDLIEGGGKHVERTYSLGAMIGDGCCRESKATTGIRQRQLSVSGDDEVVPMAIAEQLGCGFSRAHSGNYTWRIEFGPGVPDAIPFYRQWCAGRYAHEKIVDLQEIDTWDRQSCLGLLAGIIDTDGSIFFKNKDQDEIVIQIGMQSISAIEACRRIIFKFFQEMLPLKVDDRDRYKNGPVHSIKTSSNDLALRMLEALGPHLRKKGKIDTSKVKRSNVREDRIGLHLGPRRVVKTYDITVELPTNLYILHNGGIVTSNSGKTEVVKRMAVEEAWSMGHALGRWFTKMCAPTVQQAREIYWDDLILLTKPLWSKEPNKTNLVIYLRGGAEIWVCGLDKPQRIEGSPVNRLAVDELADVKAGSWDRNLLPALSTEQPGFPLARAWLFGVPRPGTQFAELVEKAKDPTKKDFAYHTWRSTDVLSEEAIETLRDTMDPRVYAQEVLAQRIDADGRAYYQFGPENLRELTYDPKSPLLFCFDFGRKPGVAVVAQEQMLADVPVSSCAWCQGPNPGSSGTPCRHCRQLLPFVTASCAIGEVYIKSGSNTPIVCTKLCTDWKHHTGPVICYGDPAGGSQTASSVDGSDWDLIKRYLAATFPQAVYDVDRKHPPQRARVNSVNMRCENANGDRRLFVDPLKAKNLVRDLQAQMVVEGGSGELDKDTDKTLGHAADAWGYCIQKLYPVDFGEKESIEAA